MARSWSAVVIACSIIASVAPASASPQDRAGGIEVLVADFNGIDSVLRLSDDGAVTGTFDGADGLVGAARAVEVGPDGLVYAAGADTGRVVRYDPADGSFVDVVVDTDAGLVNPRALAFDDRDLLVASAGTDEVVSFDLDTGERLGVVAADGLDNPGGMVIDADGLLWVASQNTDSIIGFDAVGDIESEIWTGPGSGPVDVAMGAGGELYVAAANGGRIDRVTRPVSRAGMGSGGSNPQQEAVKVEQFVSEDLVTPTAVEIGPDGALWIADHWRGTIRRVDPETGDDLGFTARADPAEATDRSVDAPFGPTDLAFLSAGDIGPDLPTSEEIPDDATPIPDPDPDVDLDVDVDVGIDVDAVAGRGVTDRGVALAGPAGADRHFELNSGQFDPSIDAALRIAGRGVSLVDGRLLIDSPGARGGNVVGLGLAGAAPDVLPVGEDPAGGESVNYFVGDLAVTGIERHGQVRYDDLLPGVGVRYLAEPAGVTYDLLLDAGVDPSSIGLTVDGVERVTVDQRGRLVLRPPTGPPLRFSAPVSYQLDGTTRIEVTSAYVIDGDGTVRFDVGDLAADLPLVIDPTLDLSTHVGGTGDEQPRDVAIDGSGNIVIVGDSTSSNYPTTAGAYDTTANGNPDIIVSALDPTGSALLWSTYVGGSGADYARELAIAADGTVYVVGNTASSDFPATGGAYDTTPNGSTDAVIVALSSDGTTLDAATFLGSSNSDDAESVDLDSSGDVVVLGNTTSSGFPTTGGAYDTTHNGSTDLYVAKLPPTLTSLQWSTFVGGGGVEAAGMIDVDDADAVWLVTGTDSSNMVTTAGAFDPTLSGSDDFWVGGLSATGATLTYGTYLGGTGSDTGPSSIHAVDAAELHVGTSATTGYPTTSGAHDETASSVDTGYVVLDTTATGAAQLSYGTALGGTGGGWAHDITVDVSGRAYIVGDASASGLATPGAPDTTLSGSWDGVLAVLDPVAATLEFRTYIGGSGSGELATGIALRSSGEAVVAGYTDSSDLATTAGAYQASSGGGADGFVQQFSALPGASGPLGRWRLDEGGGTTAIDSSGNGNDGTLVNGPSYITGVRSTGLSFAGDAAEGVEVPDPADDSLDPGTGDLAVETWMRVSAAPSNGISHPLVTKLDFQDDPAIDGFELAIFGDGGAGRLFFKIWDDAPSSQASGVWQAYDGTNDWTDGDWHHVVGQIDGSSLELWVDGTLVASSSHSAAAVVADNPLRFGVDQYGDNDYEGDLDEISIHGAALAPAAIAVAARSCLGDADGDGLCDSEEDADADGDDDPSTSPGPDTDGDATPNYRDADDDGDGTPTASENADPNGDGDPRDARDTDRDGQPDYLDREASPSTTPIAAEQKISDTRGGLTAPLGDSDEFGRALAPLGDLDGDGVNDLAVGAWGDDDGGPGRGAVHLLFLNADGTVKREGKVSDTSGGLVATLDDGDGFGRGLAGIGDLDGDGVMDLVVGAPLDDDGGSDRGAVYVLFLNADGTVRSQRKISDTSGGLAATLDDGDEFGLSVAAPGDVDGDGLPDVAVGAWADDDGGSARGAVYVLFLNADGTVRAEQKISDTAGGLGATLDDLDRFGIAVGGLGDIDGDGVGDLAVGADRDDDGGVDRGAVYILRLNADGTVKAEQKISDLTGGFATALDSNDWFGTAVAGLGDVDGDGVVDLAVGAGADDDGGIDRGAVYLLSLQADGTVKAGQKISDTTGGLTATVDDDDGLGSAAVSLGDLDSDGLLDLAVGAPNDDDGGTDRGAVYALDLTSSTAAVVDAIDDAAVARPAVAEIVDVVANDVDRNGDAVSVVDVTDPANGVAGANGDGTITYTADSAFAGSDPFDYWAIDAGAAMAHYWGLAGDAVDGVGSADGTLTGPTTVAGRFGQALDFDEIDADHVEIPDFAYAADFTISFDFKVGPMPGSFFQYIYSHGDINGTNSVNVFLLEEGHGTDPSTLRTVVRDGDDTLSNVALEIDVAPLVDDGAWHTYTATVSSVDGIIVYLDGVQRAADATRGTGGVDPGGSAYLGARHDLNADRHYDNLLDSVQVYERALTPSEVSDLSAQTNRATVTMTVAGCGDADADGLCDSEEDADGDGDGDPATSPGPDTDGDTTPDYLDADDDGDGIATAAENADPNGDGDPRDARDTDRDGEPDYLDQPTTVAAAVVATEQKISATSGGLTGPLDSFDLFGQGVAPLGDLDGDGVVDLAVGAYQDDDGINAAGAVYVLFLNADGTVRAEQKISSTQGGLTGPLDDGDQFGRDIAAIGDLDGDGRVELAVGAFRDDDGGSNRGAVYVLFLNADGTVRAEQKISAISGGLAAAIGDADEFGRDVAGLGDVDGDGVVDLAVGAIGDDDGGSNRGAVYVLFLNADGTVRAEQKISSTQGGLTGPLDDADRFGLGLSGLGDLDGDGVVDLAVGAYQDDDGAGDAGAVHVLFLNGDGTVRAEQKISAISGGLEASLDSSDWFGSEVAALGDVDGDGVVDLAVGAPGDDDGASSAGAVHLLFLNADGTTKAEGKISATSGGLTGPLEALDNFGHGIAPLGDLDGDGALQLAIGAHGDVDGASSAGAVYVVDLLPVAVVNSTADASDASPGDDVCDTGSTVGSDAECTLRAAIEEANASAAIDTIHFDLPTTDPGHVAGLWTIAPATALPPITGRLSLDATTQAGWSATTTGAPAGLDGALAVELDGSGTGAGTDGLDLRATTVLRGLVVNGFPDHGIIVRAGADGSTIAGNRIGTKPDGSAAAGNGNAGIRLDASSVIIGGALPADRNLISGNADGIYAQNPATDGNMIQGNLIGTDAAGTAAVANTDRGIQLESGADRTVIGGSSAAANVISGNGNDGIIVSDGAIPGTDTTGNTIRSNLIGVAADGASALGNGGAGVRFTAVTGNVVGGSGPNDGNRIAHNGRDGVESGNAAGNDNAIVGNAIWANGGLGIDLGPDGPTANDDGDVDSGANDLLNHPIITSAIEDGGLVDVTFALDLPAGDYRVDLFTNPTEGSDPSGHGEGEQPVLATVIAHAGAGVESFTATFAGSVGNVITATTTEDLGGGDFGATSELSGAVPVVVALRDPVVDSSIRRSDLLASTGLDPAVAERAGASGLAMDFDGVDDRLEGPALDIADAGLTLAGRVQLDAVSGTAAIISKRDTGGSPVYELAVTGSGQATATLDVGGGPVTVSGGSLAIGGWHDVVATWDGTAVVLYVDGSEVDRVAASGALATELDTTVVIGDRSSGTAGFDGLIDHAEVTHRPLAATEVALRHANTVGGTLTVTVGQQQTGAPGPWAVTTAQSRSGANALAAPTTADSGAAAWAVARGIDEPGVVLESWWWVESTTDVDLASGTRAAAAPTDQFDAAFTSGGDWALRRRSGATSSTDGTGTLAPTTGAWVEVEHWTDQNGNSRLLVDGAEVIPWTGQTSPPATGSVSFRVGRLPAGRAWYIDDARARRLISVEPVVTLGPLDRD